MDLYSFISSEKGREKRRKGKKGDDGREEERKRKEGREEGRQEGGGEGEKRESCKGGRGHGRNISESWHPGISFSTEQNSRS